MQSIKHLKKDYVQLGNLIYKPYKVCDLPNNFGFNYDALWSIIKRKIAWKK